MNIKSRKLDDFGEIESKVIAEYGKTLVHMRQQKTANRFGLVFGAGASIDLKFPSWKELIERIAKHKDINAEKLLTGNIDQSSQSQLLYEHFLASRNASAFDIFAADLQAHKIRKEWVAIIRSCLYEGIEPDAKKLNKKHPYLWAFIPTIKTSRVTINYNFDDTVERFLEDSRTDEERNSSRGYTAIWDSNVLNVPRDAVIYHPNGYIPFNPIDRGSDQVVFLEDSFGDQLIASMAGHLTALSAHIEQNTCLFIGLSLQDSTLRHLLRKSALIRSGHFHYFIHWVKDHEALSKEYREAVIAANFNTYNLVTLFLTSEEIAALAKLLNADQNRFRHLASQQAIEDCLVFYITGCVSVGKTTTIDQLRSFIGHGEWTERLLPEMRKDPKLLTKKQSANVDAWVAQQYRKKNDRLHACDPGIYVIDRAFLDAFAFTERTGWKDRAIKNRKSLNPSAVIEPTLIRKGHVILLTGDPKSMSSRAESLGKSFTKEAMENQQDVLRELYKTLLVNGVTEIDVRGLTVAEVAKRVAKTVLLGPYVPADLDAGLRRIEVGEYPPAAMN